MSATIVNTTDDNFQADVLDAETPVLVDFWAGWCLSLIHISTIIDEFSRVFSHIGSNSHNFV